MVDSTIHQGIEQGVLELPDIAVFELDQRLYSINNRRLFVWRALTCKGIASTIRATLHRHDSRQLNSIKPDHYRLGYNGRKWDRIMSTTTEGKFIRLAGGSGFAHCQAPPPYKYWYSRLESCRWWYCTFLNSLAFACGICFQDIKMSGHLEVALLASGHAQG